MATQEVTDSLWMRHALELALRGRGAVSPNPVVGCVIVKDNTLIAEGWHHAYGGLHAEIDALQNAGNIDLAGSTMYVTLEPCAHHGKQPPCADAIAETSISRIVVGSSDPNPLVHGKGLAILRAAGKVVIERVEQELCDWENRFFLHAITSELPYMIAKLARSKDDHAATMPEHGRWLTCSESRTRVHELRAQTDAVLIGVGTAIADDPELNVRLAPGRNPARVVIDPAARIPLTARLLQSAKTIPTYIITSEAVSPVQRDVLEQTGATVIALPSSNAGISPNLILRELYQRGLHSILLEGGPVTLHNFLRAKLVQEVHIHESSQQHGIGPIWNIDAELTSWHLKEQSTVGTDQHFIYTGSPNQGA